MNGFIRLSGFFRKKIEPKYYRVCCTKCGHVENVELCSSGEHMENILDDATDADVRKVGKVPQSCPVCGGKLDSRLIPVSIHFL